MIYDYILKNFSNGEPIFISEIPGSSKDVVRQELKRLTDNNKLKRLRNGVYYLPYKTIFGTDGMVSIDKYIEKKFLNTKSGAIGFLSGLSLINYYGFSTQNPAVTEICSNGATTKQRKVTIEGYKFIIYKPPVEITDKNVKELQFLSLMSVINKYSEIKGQEYEAKLKEYLIKNKINFNVVKKYLPLFPKVVYKNIFEGGLMNELL